MMMKSSAVQMANLAVVVIVATFYAVQVSGHGRLWDPPARSTMWRRGFNNTPTEYNDNQLFCGGLGHQIKQGYKCGTCGDPYDGVREHEAGGKYATGTIGKIYTQGQEVTLEVDLTANHQGWFEFKICPTNSPTTRATQDCLDRRTLQLVDVSGTKFPIDFSGARMVQVKVELPFDLTCSQCVIQWHYHAGNSWGVEENGRGCLGCGYQEEFYGCADVRINSNGGSPGNGGEAGGPAPITESTGNPTTSGRPVSETTASTKTTTPTGTATTPLTTSTTPTTTSATPTTTSTTPTTPSLTPTTTTTTTTIIITTTTSTTPTTTTSTTPTTSSSTTTTITTTITTATPSTTPTTTTTTTTTRSPSNGQGCRGNHGMANYDQWCANNCVRNYCPDKYCTCNQPDSRLLRCQAIGAFLNNGAMDRWCLDNCRLNNCPNYLCRCSYQ